MCVLYLPPPPPTRGSARPLPSPLVSLSRSGAFLGQCAESPPLRLLSPPPASRLGHHFFPLYIRQRNRQGGNACGRCRWSPSRSPQMPSAAAAAALLLQYVAALLRLFPLPPAPLQLRFGAEPWLCSSLAGLDAWQPSDQLCSLLFVWKAAAAAKGVGAWGARGLIDSDVHQWVLSFDPALDSGTEVVLGL